MSFLRSSNCCFVRVVRSTGSRGDAIVEEVLILLCWL